MIPNNYKELSTFKLKMYLKTLEESFSGYKPFGASGTMMIIDVIEAKRKLVQEIGDRRNNR